MVVGLETQPELREAGDRMAGAMGGYYDGAFFELGQGVVDFAGVFAVLNGRGFTGPFTIELEGHLATSPDPEEQEAHVRACVEHLRGLGLVP